MWNSPQPLAKKHDNLENNAHLTPWYKVPKYTRDGIFFIQDGRHRQYLAIAVS